VQEESLYDLTLKAAVQGNGQQYTPTVTASGANFEAVLDSPSLSATAIQNLVTTATERAHDGPWDGVDFDLEGIDNSYRDALTAWYEAAITALGDEGLSANISLAPALSDSDPARLAHDVGELTNIADSITLMLYASYDMNPNTAPGAVGFGQRGLDYVFGKNIAHNKTWGGLAVTSRYLDDGVAQHLSYSNGQDELTTAGEETRWYELGVDGRRFSFHRATWDADEIWVVDEDTLRVHLNLIQEYDLAGASLFILGCETSDVWPIIAEWQAGSTPWHGYIALERVDMAAGDFTTFLNYAKAQGQQYRSVPHRLVHWRTINADKVVIEAEWGNGEMSVAHCDDWLGAILDVATGDIGHANSSVTYVTKATPVTLFSHGGTDYFRLRILGDSDATWEQSRVESVGYLLA
jgi:hypothetical protein